MRRGDGGIGCSCRSCFVAAGLDQFVDNLGRGNRSRGVRVCPPRSIVGSDVLGPARTFEE